MTRTTPATALLRRRREPRPQRIAQPRVAQQPRDGERAPDAADTIAPEPGEISAEQLRRRAIAPQDQAMYTCSCGYVFAAEVSTSVDCPHCGTAQAW